MKKYTLFFVLLVSIAVLERLSAQIISDVHLFGGFSNLRMKNKEVSVVLGNFYTKLPCYGIGSDIILPFKYSSFGVGAGINFSSLAAKNNMPNDFEIDTTYNPPYTGPRNWEERFYAIHIPVFLNYKFEKWLEFSTGITNNFYLNKPKEIYDKKINKYTLSFNIQVVFVAKEKIYIGLVYDTELSPVAQQQGYYPDTYLQKIYYYYESIAIKIGYRFKKEN